ncbi:alpha/beta fold hydrolase [Alkalilimnicola sp. S0819]|uniref:alpha/beta fold hydrolase n=1 Tax=Alkalilimnicola sp. S0819 TaxID=2613922 RepID=UPI00186A9775|nr:alpha/beta hydrolase [Alkalilimnicola sp. S0819]
MPTLDTETVRLHYQSHGQGSRALVFVHGNLGCLQWMDLVWPWLSPALRVHAYDWRGCGDSAKPAPTADYSNYSLETHATDLIAFIDALGLERVDLITHSTGALIADIAMLRAPERFGEILALDPVTPRSLPFDEQALGLFQAMKADRAVAHAGLATAAPTLFEPDSLQAGQAPRYRAASTPEQQACFETLVDHTRKLSDGIWFGIPQHLNRLHHSGEFAGRLGELPQRRRILWGEQDLWIPRADVEAMNAGLPNAELRILPGVGHAMNLEAPEDFAAQVNDFFT